MTSSVEVERTVQVRNKYGLHARPAAEFVKLANQFKSDIMVTKQETIVNGKSIMGMMMLAAECGVEITVRASGPDAEVAVNELISLVETGFGED
jgi:phosphocarrier protein